MSEGQGERGREHERGGRGYKMGGEGVRVRVRV